MQQDFSIKKDNKSSDDKGKKGSKSYIEIFGLGIILIVLVVGYFLVVLPEINKRDDLDLKITEAQEEWKLKSNLYKDLYAIEESYLAVSNRNKVFLEEFIPDELGLADLLTNLSYIARDNGLDLRGVDYAVNETRDNSKNRKSQNKDEEEEDALDDLSVAELKLALQGDTDYSQFKRLIEALETNSWFMEVTQFGFDPVARDHTISVLVYFYRNK